jgi:hypothetical protein
VTARGKTRRSGRSGGLTERSGGGNFWVCEEYKPSVAMIAHDGTVQMRLVRAGTVTGLEQVPTFGVLQVSWPSDAATAASKASRPPRMASSTP